jgi:hypothetical protein
MRMRPGRPWDLFGRDRRRRAGWGQCARFAVMELGLRQSFGFDQDSVRAEFVPFR